MKDYMFEIITGPMGCGKTEELLRRIKRAVIANKSVKIFFPAIDNRISGDYIKSRNGIAREAIRVHSSKEIMAFIKSSDDIVAIDELQFFDRQIVDVVKALVKQGKKVIAAGLDLDFKEEPFGHMPELLCYANKVDKLTAICMKCGSEYGLRTQRLINGEPAEVSSPQIMIGGDETYEARCLNCYELRKSKEEKKIFLFSLNKQDINV